LLPGGAKPGLLQEELNPGLVLVARPWFASHRLVSIGVKLRLVQEELSPGLLWFQEDLVSRLGL